MRRITAVTLASLLLLTGCSGNSSGDSSASPSGSASESTSTLTPADDAAALAAVVINGPVGSEPTLTFDQPFDISAAVSRVETPGAGEPLVAGQALSLDYIGVSGADGTQVVTTYGAKPESIILGAANLIDEMNNVFTGQNVGVRVLLATVGSASEPPIIFAIEVASAKTIPTRAEGTAVAPVEGLPTVTLADDGEPSIAVPADAVAPTTLVAQPLITGAGPVVATGQTITVNYSGWLWDGTAFDSSWGENGSPFSTSIGTGAVIPGWDTGLVGATVGSQVLLVVPPDQAYGDTDNGTIPAGSTLIFVVDILDAS